MDGELERVIALIREQYAQGMLMPFLIFAPRNAVEEQQVICETAEDLAWELEMAANYYVPEDQPHEG